MRQSVGRRVKLADIPGAAFVTKDPWPRHHLAVDQVVEEVRRRVHIGRSRVPADQARRQRGREGVLPGHQSTAPSGRLGQPSHRAIVVSKIRKPRGPDEGSGKRVFATTRWLRGNLIRLRTLRDRYAKCQTRSTLSTERPYD